MSFVRIHVVRLSFLVLTTPSILDDFIPTLISSSESHQIGLLATTIILMLDVVVVIGGRIYGPELAERVLKTVWVRMFRSGLPGNE